jgi:two-component system phosphate regulon sensor histidine kinase PhoR
MFRSKFFWRLFSSYALLIFLTVGAIGALVHDKYSRSLQEQVITDLRNVAVALGELSQDDFSAVDRRYLRRRVAEVSLRTGRRITMIQRDGNVLADSEKDPDTMENHLRGRREIRDAITLGEGFAVRTSTTTGEETLYVAVCRDHDRDLGGLVRVAVLTESLTQKKREVARLLFLGALIASLPALLVGALLVRRVSTPLVQMRAVAVAMSGGDYAAASRIPKQARGGDEVGDLALSFEQLGEDINQQVADLTAGQERLRAMVAGMTEGVLALDDRDRVTFSNHAARTLLGLRDNDSDPVAWRDGKLAGLVELVQQARSTEIPARRELELSETDETAIVQAEAHSFQDGDAVGVVVVLNDVSEVRRLERIRRDFVANVSHELKTPLTNIRGYVEMLMDGAGADEDRGQRFLEIVQKNVHRLNHLVMDLLSLARIEEDSSRPALSPVDLRAFIEEGVRRHEPTAVRREQSVTVEGAERELRAMADREALQQVFDNLLDNALKYTPTGGKIVVSLRHEDGKAVLAVTDNGLGIPLEDQARIFERFYRVDKARSLEVGGTGLGLSIVKHLVQWLDGSIELDSTPGVGSTFRVYLNLAPVD